MIRWARHALALPFNVVGLTCVVAVLALTLLGVACAKAAEWVNP